MANNDYHIYIHSDSGKGGGTKPSTSNTKPTSNQGNEEQSESGSGNNQYKVSKAIRRVTGFGTGTKNIATTMMGSASKGSIAIASTYALGKVADTVMSKVADIQSNYYGDYKWSIQLNNLKTIMGNITNPIGYIFKRQNQWLEYRQENLAREQQRELAGVSITNISGRNV